MENTVDRNRLPFDIKAEVFAYLLSKTHGLSVEQVLFEPTNFFQRRGRKDILDVAEDFSYKLGKKTIRLQVSREGFFDVLPEDLFIHSEENYDNAVDYANNLQEQELAARKFLLPFEQLFYWLGLENEEREFKAEDQLEQWWLGLLFQEEEGQDSMNSFLSSDLLNQDQKAAITKLIPQLSDIVGRWTLIEQWLSLLLNTEVSIQHIPPPEYAFPEELQRRLGDGVLGQDLVIGGAFSDGVEIIEVTIEQLTPENLGSYLEGGEKRNLLEKILLPLFMPVEIPYQIETNLSIQSQEFQLGERFDSSILGYTSTLNI